MDTFSKISNIEINYYRDFTITINANNVYLVIFFDLS